MRAVALASDIKLALIVETVAIGRVGKFAFQLTSSSPDEPTRKVLLGVRRIEEAPLSIKIKIYFRFLGAN